MPITGKDKQAELANQEDIAAENFLSSAQFHGLAPLSTPESIQRGRELIAQAEKDAITVMAARIASNELITAEDLQRALNVTQQAINNAVDANRLFAIASPSGRVYYPAYYADKTLDLRALERVTKTLRSLPALSKHHFFMSKLVTLQETPIDALRNGREVDVIAAADDFVR